MDSSEHKNCHEWSEQEGCDSQRVTIWSGGIREGTVKSCPKAAQEGGKELEGVRRPSMWTMEQNQSGCVWRHGW